MYFASAPELLANDIVSLSFRDALLYIVPWLASALCLLARACHDTLVCSSVDLNYFFKLEQVAL